MKLCIDCLHLRVANMPEYSRCGHPLAAKVHPVTGEPSAKFCQTMRLFENECGESAKLFEAAPAQAAE